MDAHNSMLLVIRAADFAAIKHRTQRRKDPQQTPYINHPVGVANILANEANITDPYTLAAALLHDTVEDTNTTFDEIEVAFGDVVRAIVAEVTDDKTQPKAVRKQLQIDTAASKSPRAKLVKLADKLYNLRDVERALPVGWTKSDAKDYFAWAFAVINQLRGTNQVMEAELDKLFKQHGLI